MEKEKIALVIEGGGMRGAYATGVLDFLLDQEIPFSACYGVSAGAGHACSFLSKQKGRAIRVNTKFISDPRYASFRSLIKTGDFFGCKFIYETIPDVLDPYDYKTFNENPTKFYAVATNLITGEPEYFQIKDMKKDMPKIIASSSLPFLAKTKFIDNVPYLDGGISDSIPFQKAIQDGHSKVVVILTRDKNYRKEPFKLKKLLQLKYRKYPEFIEAMLQRAKNYNETLEKLEEAYQTGKIFVIRPSEALQVGRLEKNANKLLNLHSLGYSNALNLKEELLHYLSKSEI